MADAGARFQGVIDLVVICWRRCGGIVSRLLGSQ